MAETWFTSDTHFGHENIIRFCNRPFGSVTEMNATLVENWNATIKPEDTVYHLGDVAMGHFATSWECVKQLHGKKRLILGNHDRVAQRYGMSEKYLMKYGKWYADAFESIGYNDWWEGYQLHHFPYDGDHTSEVRFQEHRPEPSKKTVIHGHVHEQWQTQKNQLNVGVDVWNFFPVHADIVLSMARVLDPTYGIT